MFSNVSLAESAKDKSVDITGKHYSGFGITVNDFSRISGISVDMLESYDDWYILDDEYYYFKKHSIFEELFMSELAYECRVRCVSFQLAMNGSNSGIISKLYREKDKKYYMYSDFCKEYFKHEPDNLRVFKLASSIFFGDEKTEILMDDIFGLISFDMFSGQWDRREHNLFFECYDDGPRIAPLCDNGMVFSKNFIYQSPFGELSLSHLDQSDISRRELLFLVQNEKKFYTRLAKLLDIDISEILKRCIEKYKIVIDSYDERKLLTYFDNRKKAIEYTLKRSNNR